MLNLISLLLGVGCDGEPPAPQVTVPTPPAAGTMLLARHPDQIISLELPPRNREGAVPESFPTLNGWLPGEITAQQAVYTTANPTLATLSPALPEGFAVLDGEGRPLRFVRDGSGGPGSWGVNGDHIVLVLTPGTDPASHRIRYPDATERLTRFNFADAGLPPKEFALRTERLKGTRHYGVYLPAPAAATWSVTVPRDGRLVADAAVLRSPWRAEHRSDGVTLYAEVIAAGEVTVVAELAVGPGQWRDLEADLSGWAGQEIELRLRVDPGGDNLEDYLLVGEPTLYTPQANPRRIVMFFADTLRADHMGLYGYERETTPNIDRWAQGAAVFDDARSVAPWTYPSARSVLSGRMPDQWSAGPVLPELLAEAGWSTVAFTNNAYLSRFFGMDRGWSWHFYSPDLNARGQFRTLDAALKKNTDRDTVYLVQLMDVHLPYKEPEPYRTLFVEADPGDLPDPITRTDVLNYGGDEAVVRRYLIDRYDQSLRFLDRAIAPIFERLDANDTVIFFSDHGEELGDHGGFEHGHSLYDELLSVPLIIQGPGVPAGRISEPVSLLDLAPTVLDIAGVELAEGVMQGRSLLPAARGEPAALAELAERPLGAGFVLYEADGWSVVSGGEKWITQGGVMRSYDLSSDPGEQSPVVTETAAALAPWRAAASEALQRPVGPAWRLVNPEGFSERPGEIRLSAPGGVAAAWAGLESPNIPSPEITHEGGEVVIVAAGGGVMPKEIFARLTAPGEDLTVALGGSQAVFVAGEPGQIEGVSVGVTVTAQPSEVLQTTASSVESQLQALGYLE